MVEIFGADKLTDDDDDDVVDDDDDDDDDDNDEVVVDDDEAADDDNDEVVIDDDEVWGRTVGGRGGVGGLGSQTIIILLAVPVFVLNISFKLMPAGTPCATIKVAFLVPEEKSPENRPPLMWPF